MELTVKIPEKLEFLLLPSRYKVAYGGRGGAKSWSFARVLIAKSLTQPLRILCAREIQRSIKDSVHLLLSDQIKHLGLQDYFTITASEIIGHNGSQFGFEGLRYNVDSIRSKEGIDICAVFEAKNVSKNSWETLIPTIRKPGSEIWLEFNPELETDETYQRFVRKPPTTAIVKKIGWQDNPWFPEVLKLELDQLKARDYDSYLNVWEGHCRVTLDGAIYANELREAVDDQRICHVPVDHRVPVHTFWDLGFADHTSIWFAQKVGFEYHVIDFYQNRLQMLPHYIKVLQDRGYVYGRHKLPHDGDYQHVAAPSVKQQLEQFWPGSVDIVERIPKIEQGIDATRTIFNRLYFDEVKCADGIQALRHYAYKVDEYGQWGKKPNHDVNSHAADALRTLGESISAPDRMEKAEHVQLVQYSREGVSAAWME